MKDGESIVGMVLATITVDGRASMGTKRALSGNVGFAESRTATPVFGSGRWRAENRATGEPYERVEEARASSRLE